MAMSAPQASAPELPPKDSTVSQDHKVITPKIDEVQSHNNTSVDVEVPAAPSVATQNHQPQSTSNQQPSHQKHQSQQNHHHAMAMSAPQASAPGQTPKIDIPERPDHIAAAFERIKLQNAAACDENPNTEGQGSLVPDRSDEHSTVAPPPVLLRPNQTPWQSWESFRGYPFKEVPLATTDIPSNEVYNDASNVIASGRRKALLIGINYAESPAPLQGCVNDAKNIKNLLIENGFTDDPTHMVMLTDEEQNSKYLPTKANIRRGFQWLTQGVSEGDVLFLHFSGHGSQVSDEAGMEEDGLNETILPMDYQKGQITDDMIWSSVVYPLPSGVKLTVVMDCCHSGTGLDLPFDYEPYTGRWVEETNPAHSKGHVVLFASCEDAETSADAIGKYQAGGAMTQSFILAYKENPMPKYPEFMAAIHGHLIDRHFKQRPQLTSSQELDTKNSRFSLIEGIQPNKNRTIGRIQRKKIRPGSADDRRNFLFR